MSEEPQSPTARPKDGSFEKFVWLKSPLVVAIVGAVVALGAQIAHDAWSESLKQSQAALDENARQFQGRLIQAAIEHDDPNRVIAKLQLLKELDLVPAYRDQITQFLSLDTNAQKVTRSISDEELKKYQAALIERIVGSDDIEKIKAKFQMLNDADLLPQYKDQLQKILIQKALAAVTGESSSSPPPQGKTPDVAPAIPAEATGRCAALKSLPEAGDGWIFLGRMNQGKTAWISSPSGTKSIRFDGNDAPVTGDIAVKLKGQCFHTLIPKYLREDGPAGERVTAAVKKTVPANTHFRILEVDDTGTDKESNSNYPVVWARVETLIR